MWCTLNILAATLLPTTWGLLIGVSPLPGNPLVAIAQDGLSAAVAPIVNTVERSPNAKAAATTSIGSNSSVATDATLPSMHAKFNDTSGQVMAIVGGTGSHRQGREAITLNTSSNKTSSSILDIVNAAPAVGKVFSVYYSTTSDAQATSVEALDEYRPVARESKTVWSGDGSRMLPTPSCPLQLISQTSYPSKNRVANLRLAELAVCELLGETGVPSCGAKVGEVCQLKLLIPMTSSDKLQEPFTAAAAALVARSKLCALGKSSYNSYQCEIKRASKGICAGLELRGESVELTGPSIPGLIQNKLQDAYVLQFSHVFLAAAIEDKYEQTEFHGKLTDVLAWQHTPPQVHFCRNLACLVSNFM